MSTTIDTYINEYRARDAGATSVANRIAGGIERIESRVKSMANTINFAIAAAAGSKLVDWTRQFVGASSDASSRFQSMEARLKAFTGSLREARREITLAEMIAEPSTFSFSQLGDAAAKLEAFRVNALRALPTVAYLGQAFDADQEHIEMLSRMIGELAAGNFPDKEVMSSFGLSKRDFEMQGIQFDGQGALKSSAVKTLDALERIARTKYGAIFDEMANTPAAKAASLADSWERLQRKFGEVFLRRSAPFQDALTRMLKGLVSSGVIDETLGKLFGGGGAPRKVDARLDILNASAIASSGMDPAQAMAASSAAASDAQGAAKWLIKAAAWTIAVVEEIPGALKIAGDFLKDVWGFIKELPVHAVDLAITLANAAADLFNKKADQVITWIENTFDTLVKRGVDFINVLKDGMVNAAHAVVATFKHGVDGVVDAINAIKNLPILGMGAIPDIPHMALKPRWEVEDRPYPESVKGRIPRPHIGRIDKDEVLPAAQKWWDKTAGGMQKWFDGTAVGKWTGGVSDRAGDLEMRLSAAMAAAAGGPGGIPDTRRFPWLREMSDPLSRIEEHTRRTAAVLDKAFDPQKHLLGGNGLADAGVTVEDMSRIKRSLRGGNGSGGGVIQIEVNGTDELSRAVAKMIEQGTTRMVSSGRLKTARAVR